MLRVSRPGEVAVVYADNLRNEVIVIDDADSELGNGHCSSFLRRVRRFVCVAASSLRRRGKEPDRPSMNRGAMK